MYQPNEFILVLNDQRLLISYKPDPFNVEKVLGEAVDSFSIRSINELDEFTKDAHPLSETGSSHKWINRPYIDEFKTPRKFITSLIEDRARAPEWQKYLQDHRQLDFF